MSAPLLAPLKCFAAPDLDAWRARVGAAFEDLLATEAPADAPIGRRAARGWTIGALVADAAQAERARADGAQELEWTTGLDLGVYHRAGATAVQELAFLAAALLERQSAPARVILEVGRGLFDEVAKLRAARVLWHKALAAAGAGAPAPPSITAVTAWRTQTLREPMNNVLRATTQAFAAVVGGADTLVVRPHEDTDAARRLALQLQLVLRHEAQLGRVADPAGGSYLVEQRTDELARAAWEGARAIVEQGGLARALEDGRAQAQCAASWEAWAARLRAGEAHVLGVSLHPDPEAPMAAGLMEPAPVEGLPAHRDEEVFA